MPDRPRVEDEGIAGHPMPDAAVAPGITDYGAFVVHVFSKGAIAATDEPPPGAVRITVEVCAGPGFGCTAATVDPTEAVVEAASSDDASRDAETVRACTDDTADDTAHDATHARTETPSWTPVNCTEAAYGRDESPS